MATASQLVDALAGGSSQTYWIRVIQWRGLHPQKIRKHTIRIHTAMDRRMIIQMIRIYSTCYMFPSVKIVSNAWYLWFLIQPVQRNHDRKTSTWTADLCLRRVSFAAPWLRPSWADVPSTWTWFRSPMKVGASVEMWPGDLPVESTFEYHWVLENNNNINNYVDKTSSNKL